MKRCPACDQTYADDALSFCPNDGASLVGATGSSYNPQATIMAPPPSVTQPPSSFNDPAPNDWSTPSSYAPPPSDWSSPGAWQQPSSPQGMPGMMQTTAPEQGLAIAALVMGVLGLICIPILAPIAVVIGFVALGKANNDPARYGGKGMAIGGMIAGGIMTLLLVLFFFLVIISNMRL